MQQQNWFAQLLRRRILWSAIQSIFWGALAILSWRHDPRGIFVWIMSLLFVLSLYMLRLEVVSRRVPHP